MKENRWSKPRLRRGSTVFQAVRINAGFTQEQAAACLGISVIKLRRIEQGLRYVEKPLFFYMKEVYKCAENEKIFADWDPFV